jgi:hypothetical protein
LPLFVRIPFVAALAACLASVQTPQAPSIAGPQTEAVLASARTAMGGAALDAITALSANGSLTEQLGSMTTSRSLDLHYQRPGQFLLTTRSTFNDPFGGGFTMTMRRGINGGELIDDVIAPGAPMPVMIPAPEPRTPEEARARRERAMRARQIEIARVLLPLFAGSQGVDQWRLEAKEATAITATGPAGAEVILHLDPATHLPSKLTWHEPAPVIMKTSSTVTATSRGEIVSESRGAPPSAPPGTQPDVLWSMTIDDYKTENGVTWPRRFRVFIGSTRTAEVRFGRYKINPKIDPRTFDVRK